VAVGPINLVCGLGVVAFDPGGGSFVKALNVVDVLDVSLHIATPRRYIIGVVAFQGPEGLMVLPEAALNLLGQEILKRGHRPCYYGLVCGRDCRPQVPTGGLKACVRGTLSGAMNTDQGLKEGAVG
jgi:hypothetical protein